jgi:BirA family transcriptional regulator, biotin operon repressor / biotin---[acetyl-CoA-carboxylase] ligase
MRPLLVPAPPANLVWLDEVESTNAMAAGLLTEWMADEGEEPFPDTVIVARQQTAGQGRGSHRWESPPGGLYASWAAAIPGDRLAVLPLAAGVSLAEAVEDVVPDCSVGLKWPNDLQVEGGKLGGILCQARSRGETGYVVVGVGVNVQTVPALPEGARGSVTALRALGLEDGAEDALWKLLAGFLARIRKALDDPAASQSRWAARSLHRPGEMLRIRSGAEIVVGAYVGFGPAGELQLDVDGSRRDFPAGELVDPLPDSGG